MIFLRVHIHLLKEMDTPLPFNLIFRNNHTGVKNLACAKGDILNSERMADIALRVEKGEELIIPDTALETFEELFEDPESPGIVKELNKKQLALRELEKERAQRFEKEYPEKAGLFEKLLHEARLKDSFSSLVEAARAEIESYPLSQSQHFSTMIAYSSFCLSRNGELPAGCAFIFFLGKKLGIKEPMELMNLMAAYSLREIGCAYLKLGKQKHRDPDYEKYPLFSQHILTLSKANFPKDVSRFIMEHRENHNETGFPRGKNEEQTHFHSYIVGAVHLLFHIYYKDLKGRFIDQAITQAANSGVIHPQISTTLYSLKR